MKWMSTAMDGYGEDMASKGRTTIESRHRQCKVSLVSYYKRKICEITDKFYINPLHLWKLPRPPPTKKNSSQYACVTPSPKIFIPNA